MPGVEHTWMTDLAFGLLPAAQQEWLSARRARLCSRDCLLPDLYFDVRGPGHEQALPYYVETDGIQFHYVPDTPIVPLYRYYTASGGQLRLLQPYRNEHYRHVARGFRHYLDRALEALRNNDLDAGCSYAGCLLHFLQDYGYGAHAVEGPYGTDFFLFQRLFPESESIRELPDAILNAAPPAPTPTALAGYRPRLLGADTAEIVFHLYTRHVRVTTAARRLCHQIVRNALDGRAAANPALFEKMYTAAIHLCADVLFTLLWNARADVEPDTVDHLNRVLLSDMEPIQRPWLVSMPYRTLALVRDAALDSDRQRIPLELRLERDGHPVRFEHGFGMGCHYETVLAFDVPAGVYETFTCALGLHAAFGQHGDVDAALLQNGTPVFTARFHSDAPGTRIQIRDPGGRIELRLRASAGLEEPANNMVWAEPVLARRVTLPASDTHRSPQG